MKKFKVTYETREEFTEEITADSRESAAEKIRDSYSTGTIEIRSVKEEN